MDVALFAAVTVAVSVLGILAARAAQSRRQDLRPEAGAWRTVAEARGLRFYSERPGPIMLPSIEGTIRGHQFTADVIEVQGQRTGYLTVVRTEVTGLLPEGLRLAPEGVATPLLQRLGLQDLLTGDEVVDPRVRCTADDVPAARVVLGDLEVKYALRQLVDDDAEIMLQGRSLRAQFQGLSGEDIGRRLDAIVVLAEVLPEALARPWQRLARRHGLQLTIRGKLHVAEGTIGDLGLAVRAGRGPEDAHSRLSVRVRLPVKLPGRMGIVSREGAGGEPGIELPDPILTRLLMVTSRTPGIAARLLDDDELRGDLLAVVHGHPGSSVMDDLVFLETPELPPGAADEVVELALTLARSLVRRVGEIGQ